MALRKNTTAFAENQVAQSYNHFTESRQRDVNIRIKDLKIQKQYKKSKKKKKTLKNPEVISGKVRLRIEIFLCVGIYSYSPQNEKFTHSSLYI